MYIAYFCAWLGELHGSHARAVYQPKVQTTDASCDNQGGGRGKFERVK